jgi:hypothetical protein
MLVEGLHKLVDAALMEVANKDELNAMGLLQSVQPHHMAWCAHRYLVDDAWADAFGTLTITTAAWLEEGTIDSSFKRGKGTELWGRFYGSEHTRAEPK